MLSVLLSLALVLLTVVATLALRYFIQFFTLVSKYKHLPGVYQSIHPVFVMLLVPNFLKKLFGLKYDKTTKVFVDYADAMFKKYPDAPFIKFLMGTQFPLVLVADAEFPKFLALKESKIGNKQINFFQFIEHQFGPSVLSLSDDTKWKRHRLLSEPAFTQKALALQSEVIVDTMRQYIDIIAAKSSRNILADGYCITLDVIGKAAFGFDFKAVEGARAPKVDPSSIASRTNALLQNFVFYQASPEIVKKVPIGPMYEVHQTQFALKRVVSEIIGKREEEKQQGIIRAKPDILDLLMKGTELQPEGDEEAGERQMQAPLSKEELSANCISFLLAGHETTARGLTFCAYLLSMHKDVQKKAQESLDKVLQDRDAPDQSDLDSLEYIDAIIKETLRLYPVVRVLGRKLIADLEYKGQMVPAGAFLFMYFPRYLRDPAFWKDPDVFRPERWLEKETQAKLSQNPFQYSVFGVGKHVCIGRRLATMELSIALSMLLKKFTLHLENEAEYGEMEVDETITCAPSKPVFIRFEKRQ